MSNTKYSMNTCELMALSRNKNKSATNVEFFVNRELDLLPVLKLCNTRGSSMTINCLRPADYFTLVFLQDSWMSALQFLLFICIYFVMRFRTYCALVTICSSTSGLSASNWNWGGKSFPASSLVKNEAQGWLGLSFLFFFSFLKTPFTSSSNCVMLE